jgi:hypothetical protein
VDFNNKENFQEKMISTKQVKILMEDKLCVDLTNTLTPSPHHPENSTNAQQILVNQTSGHIISKGGQVNPTNHLFQDSWELTEKGATWRLTIQPNTIITWTQTTTHRQVTPNHPFHQFLQP